MKKILLCMVLAGLMMPVVAQRKMNEKINISFMNKTTDLGITEPVLLPINKTKTFVEVDGWTYSGISEKYDRQSQGSSYPMTQVHNDGFIGSTWTNEDNLPFSEGGSNPKRGVGYSFSVDGGITWSEPDLRAGGIPLYWPSYAQWGKNGEAILARSADTYLYNDMQIVNGLLLLTRENKGVGEWTITCVPYPDGFTPPTYVMAWARMTTSGEDHQYIHILSPIRFPDQVQHPVYYYRTQDGKTWDIESVEVSELTGEEWPKNYSYNDGINFAVKGETVVASFIDMGNHGYVLRTKDNGDNWKCIKFFDSPVRRDITHDEFPDSVYIPNQGCVALDNDGKIHVAFAAIRSMNSTTTGEGISYWPWAYAQFLSYWNEDMPMIDGAIDFSTANIAPLLMGYPYFDGAYFDWEKTQEDPAGRYYVNSTTPEWPVIGYFIPVLDDNYYTFLEDAEQWAGSSYGNAGMFSYPQMAFDIENRLHLVYLGLLDGGIDEDHWLRHPFYTTKEPGENIWTQTEYPVNNLDFITNEFAYLDLAGIYNDRIYFMAQTDQYAGVFTQYNYSPPMAPDHGAVNNYYTFFYFEGLPQSNNELERTTLSMKVYPNPASGKVSVRFDGKGDITIFNMLGQIVYHVENVVKEKEISLNNLTQVFIL